MLIFALLVSVSLYMSPIVTEASNTPPEYSLNKYPTSVQAILTINSSAGAMKSKEFIGEMTAMNINGVQSKHTNRISIPKGQLNKTFSLTNLDYKVASTFGNFYVDNYFIGYISK